MTTALPIVYLFLAPDIMDDLEGYALAADGTLLIRYPFPGPETARARMNRPTRLYRRYYPDGYRLVWQPAADDAGFVEARRLNREAWDAGREARAADTARQSEALREARRAQVAENRPLLAVSAWEVDVGACEEGWDETDYAISAVILT